MCSKREPIVIVIPEHEQKAWFHLLHSMKMHIGIDQRIIEAARQKMDPAIENFLHAYDVQKSDVEKLTDKLIKKTYDHARS